MANSKSAPETLAQLIEQGAVLSGFDWPETTQEIGISIDREGVWHHNGSPINKPKICRLFSTVLNRDGEGRYWLVTPVERGEVSVADAPFVAVEMAVEGGGENQVLKFRTNLDHWVTAGPDHPIRMVHDPETGEPTPYVEFRDRLDARIARSVYYDLVELCEAAPDAGGDDAEDEIGVWSGGTFFALGRVE